jgi:putative thiamine transport system permease protein
MKAKLSLAQCLAWPLVGAIFLPLLPGLALMVRPLLASEIWLSVRQDPQFAQALLATLVSTLISAGGALAITLIIVCGLWPGVKWRRYVQRLPLMLAFPHVAFASGFLFLFAENSWLARLVHLSLPVDSFGVGLGAMLALKEAWFLLWFASTQLAQHQLEQQLIVARTLGYGPLHGRFVVLIPQLLPRLGWAMVAILAYSLSAVDVAAILGPDNPPTLAVLAWQWMSDADPRQQAMGTAGAMLLPAILGVFVLLGRAAWHLVRARSGKFSGRRYGCDAVVLARGATAGMSLLGVAAIAILAVWSVAQAWFYPAVLPDSLTLAGWQSTRYDTLSTALWLALASSLLATGTVLLWLESSSRRFDLWLWLPLLLPALPLAAGQYQVLLRIELEGTWPAVIWSHLLWMMPYTLLVLKPAWLRLDARHPILARTFGWSAWKILWWIKVPLLLRPILGAVAVGFSVSVAQYLPTLYAGAGRFATVTTEAVAQSSGGDPQQLAIQALLQTLLPAAMFIFTVKAGQTIGRYRQGLR